MKITREESLRYFDFWSGAKDRAALLTPEELDTVESYLESDGTEYSETMINDLFWFDFDFICSEILGIGTEDDVFEAREPRNV